MTGKTWTTLFPVSNVLNWELYKKSLAEALIDRAGDRCQEPWIGETAWTGTWKLLLFQLHSGDTPAYVFEVTLTEGESYEDSDSIAFAAPCEGRVGDFVEIPIDVLADVLVELGFTVVPNERYVELTTETRVGGGSRIKWEEACNQVTLVLQEYDQALGNRQPRGADYTQVTRAIYDVLYQVSHQRCPECGSTDLKYQIGSGYDCRCCGTEFLEGDTGPPVLDLELKDVAVGMEIGHDLIVYLRNTHNSTILYWWCGEDAEQLYERAEIIGVADNLTKIVYDTWVALGRPWMDEDLFRKEV